MACSLSLSLMVCYAAKLGLQVSGQCCRCVLQDGMAQPKL